MIEEGDNGIFFMLLFLFLTDLVMELCLILLHNTYYHWLQCWCVFVCLFHKIVGSLRQNQYIFAVSVPSMVPGAGGAQ